jgi:protein TonB
VLHGLAAAAVVIVPLLGEELLPPENASVARAFFVAPALAPVPPPPPPLRQRSARGPKGGIGAFTAPVGPRDHHPDFGLTSAEGGVPAASGGSGGVGGVVGGLDAPPPLYRSSGSAASSASRGEPARRPVYPNTPARQDPGRGILECTISPQGRVEGVQVLRGIPTLDDAAVEAVKKWAYTPTLLGGVPVGVVMTVTVNFVLQQQTASF